MNFFRSGEYVTTRHIFVVSIGIQMAHGYSTVGGSEPPQAEGQTLSLDLATLTQDSLESWHTACPQRERERVIELPSSSFPCLGPAS